MVEESLMDVFMVEIGGDMENSRVSIYDSSDINFIGTKRLNSTTAPNITSVYDYRYFWILWNAEKLSIHVGTGHALYDNMILSANASAVTPRVYLTKINVVSISTTTSNTGHWRFNNPVPGTTANTKQIPTIITQRTRLPFIISTTDTRTAPKANLATVSNTEQIPITFTQRTTVSFSTSTLEHRIPPFTSHLSTNIQPSDEMASKSAISTSVELKTIFADAKQITFGVINVSNTSDILTTYSVSRTHSTAAFSTPSIYYDTVKSFPHTPGHVAALGVVAGAAGLVATGVAGYIFIKKSTKVDSTSVR